MDLKIQFMEIIKAALEDRQLTQAQNLSQAQWQALLCLAQQHHVLPMVYDAVRTLPELQNTSLQATLRTQHKHSTVSQARKSYALIRLLQQFQQSGIPVLVVKGILCRDLYPHPDSRTSADEDLLIRPEDFPACHRILTENGMVTTATETDFAGTHEISYQHRDSPLYIELHRSLFPEKDVPYADLNRFFSHVFDQPITRIIDGNPILTLSDTDHLFYLICHALKHFLHSGFGIRQVCDITLFANARGAYIDYALLYTRCRQIHCEYFAAAIFAIGKRYLTFDPEKAHFPKQWLALSVNETPLLQDILTGGVYGTSNPNRQHSSNMMLDAFSSGARPKRPEKDLLRSAFPPIARLKSRYPWLKKYPWLLPVAWIRRIVAYIGKFRPKDTAETLSIGTARVELLKEYRIIPQNKTDLQS